MPTWKQVEEKYGKHRADAMKKCPYLNGITLTIKRAFALFECNECQTKHSECVDPYDNYPMLYCHKCDAMRKHTVKQIIKMESDIPQHDIDIAYRWSRDGFIDPEELD